MNIENTNVTEMNISLRNNLFRERMEHIIWHDMYHICPYCNYNKYLHKRLFVAYTTSIYVNDIHDIVNRIKNKRGN